MNELFKDCCKKAVIQSSDVRDEIQACLREIILAQGKKYLCENYLSNLPLMTIGIILLECGEVIFHFPLTLFNRYSTFNCL